METRTTIKDAEEQEENVRLAVLKKMYDLFTAALSLVAALAWNDAIQSLFGMFFGKEDSLVAKFFYAVFLTVIIVWFSTRLARVTKAAEKRLRKKNN